MRLYRAIRYGQALSDCDAVASVGSKGDSYDNALAEALNSLYKAELIRNHKYLDEHGPWQGIDDVELATAEWVHWFNTVRPHSAIDMHAPVEHEQTCTPPQEDANTITDIIDNADAQDIGEQTTINQAQPATAGAR
ncbi:integrase core domain-containing protein [Actinomyces ruminicola]|uniref:Integrase core domain-containing protein n=1 Tax=Actinomyces ruminicola TaxID=332524 RepID=A0A1H0AJQ2_9ACTO|nr:integrase core domain-containing protein [Actinomyces ruminicola]SDN33798.1 Integrase core domain-containing protein [Actinomyces ruminicola]